MSQGGSDWLTLIGIIVGLFLIAAGLGTVVTAPWQYQASLVVAGLRIIGTIGTILIGLGLIYVVWGHAWLTARNAAP